MEIVLVGNSSSVMDKKRGQEIDEFDFVARYNNFVLTNEFSQYVGKKTSYIFCRCTDDVKLRDLDTFDRIYFCIPRCRYTQAMLPIARNYKAYYGAKCEILNIDKTSDIAKTLDEEDFMNEWPSIGLISIHFLLHSFKRLHLVGFDGMSGGHYFPRPPNDSKFHNWEKEQEYIKKLEKEGKVVCL